jgi:hypothetical protein
VGCPARRYTPGCGSWTRRATREAAFAARAAGQGGWSNGTLACCKYWTSWSILTPAGIRKAPCLWTCKSTRQLADALAA